MFVAEKQAEMMDNLESFFRGKSIFITGATGFVGKILIEKLLRSFPNLDAIYLLIRNKGDKNAARRLQKIVDCEVIFVKFSAHQVRQTLSCSLDEWIFVWKSTKVVYFDARFLGYCILSGFAFVLG